MKMPVSVLWQHFEQYAPFAAAAEAFRSGQPVSIEGVIGSSAALAAAALRQSFFQNGHQKDFPAMLIAAESEESAEKIAGDLEIFLDHTLFDRADFDHADFDHAASEKAGVPKNTGNGVAVFYFPPLDTEETEIITETAAAMDIPADPASGERLRVLKHLLFHAGEPCVIAASMTALQQHVPLPEILKNRTQILAVNDRLDLDRLCRKLAENGFHAASATALPGEFAVRGYILDLFAPDWNQPVRIELFGDTIESIRRFDPATQRSLEKMSGIDLTLLRADETAGASLLDYLPHRVPVVWLPEELP